MSDIARERRTDPTAMKVSDEAAVELRGMNKWFGSFHVLRDVDLAVHRGERIAICGSSGSGKSTLIRCINRLKEHQQGKIIVNEPSCRRN